MGMSDRKIRQNMGDGDGNTQIGIQNNYYAVQKKEAVVQECHERYQNDWNKKMFLTDGIKLCDLHMLPYYEEERGERLKEFLDLGEYYMDKSQEIYENLEERLRAVLDSSDDLKKRMLLILGHPGSGKTTLMTYILNHYSKELSEKKVRMYCFRSFKNMVWNDSPENLFNKMLEDMGLTIDDLSNSVLILDGLDEVNMLDHQIEFLNSLCEDWAESRKIINFSLFVTCRVNRISDKDMLVCPYIQLCPLQENQIEEFVNKYNIFDSSSVNTEASIRRLIQRNEELKEVLGIPLILYMILALHIELNKETNLVEIYQLIFSTESENSIYRRGKYDHMHVHAITVNAIEEIHQFSKEIAVQMWKDKNKEAVVKKEDYERIAGEVASNVEVRDLLIGQYFMEGKDSCELYFVHRSMYQYFVALSIFDSIKDMIDKGNPDDQFKDLIKNCYSQKDSCIIPFARIIGIDLIYSDPDIEQYLLYMLKNLPIEDEQWWKNFFACFLDKGLMRYCDSLNESTIKCFEAEVNRFHNLIWLIREQLRKIDNSQRYYKISNIGEKFRFYLHNERINANLKEIDLDEADLSGANLRKANISGANLRKANLRRVNLSRADLIGADISGANLDRANISGADLDGADISGATLVGADIRSANLRKANISEATLVGADISSADLDGADIRRANLVGANLVGAYINEANLVGANLVGAYISGATLVGANISEANLVGANISGANLSGSNLRRTDLSGSNLRGANLSETDLRGADLRGADLIDIIVDKEELRKAILDEENYKKFFGDESE